MELIINGESRNQPDGLSVADLLSRLEMTPAFVAVEINKQLVPRRRHAETTLNDGDVLEIVTLVGGG